MVDYLYIFDYSVAPEDEIDPILLHARVYIIADEFNIPALKMLAKEKFEQLATFDCNNSSFSLAISEIYELPPDDRGLRDVVVTVARKHVKALRDRGEFNTVLRDKPDFTIDLLDLALKADEGDSRVDEQKVYEPKADGPEVDEDPWGFQGFSSKKKVKKGQFCSQCHDCGKYCLP